MPEKYFKSIPNKFKFSTKWTRKEVHHKAELAKAEKMLSKVVDEDHKPGKQKAEKGGGDILSMKDIKIWPVTPVAPGIKILEKTDDKNKVEKEMEMEKAIILL